MQIQNKKAQTNLTMVTGVVGVVVLLVAIGIIFSSGFKALNELSDLAVNNVATIDNETITWIGNNSAVQLVQGGKLGISSLIIYNNGTLVTSGDGNHGNYTVDAKAGSFKIINASPSGKVGIQSEWVTNTINASYTFYIGSQEYNTTLQSKEGVKVVSDFQPTWALIVAIGILITALLIPLFVWVIGKL